MRRLTGSLLALSLLAFGAVGCDYDGSDDFDDLEPTGNVVHDRDIDLDRDRDWDPDLDVDMRNDDLDVDMDMDTDPDWDLDD